MGAYTCWLARFGVMRLRPMSDLPSYIGYVQRRLGEWCEPSQLSVADLRVVKEAHGDAVGSLTATERVINHRKARKQGLGLHKD
jgi:hypothetical protein